MIDFDDEPDQEKRIEKLRSKLKELGDEISHESDLSADLEEEFLKHILGSGSDEDMELYMKYYSDEEYREKWAKDFPDFVMPPREVPPFDRDKELPKSPFG